jgi:hypothetical protein
MICIEIKQPEQDSSHIGLSASDTIYHFDFRIRLFAVKTVFVTRINP